MKAIWLAAATGFLLSSAAAAQTTSYSSNNQSPKRGDPKDVVCEVEKELGSRIGRRKVCLTVEQWNEKHKAHREFTESIQIGTRTLPSEDPEGGWTPQLPQ